jgi:hypothetical protein
LPEFDHEMANTRKVLERIPENTLGWKALERSNTIGWVGRPGRLVRTLSASG